jgi:hypothetical protein
VETNKDAAFVMQPLRKCFALTFLFVFLGRKTFGKSWWDILQNMETKEDRRNKRPYSIWRLVFSLSILTFSSLVI